MKSGNLPLQLKALRAFEVVSRHLSVKGAARELNVTPSAVSHLIKRLEDDLGVQLIRRSGRNISLTDPGEKLAPGLQDAFESLTKAVNSLRDLSHQNTLTISLRPYFAVKWLAPRLSRFWARYPKVELRLHHTTEPIDFIADSVDLAIEWSTGSRSGVRHHELIPGELVPIFSPDMLGAETITEPNDLLRFTLLKEMDFNSWEEWFFQANKERQNPPFIHYIDDSNVRHQAALDGLGVELSCRSLIREEVASGALLAPFDVSVDCFSYYLVEPIRGQRSPLAQQFKNWIINEAKNI